MVCTFFGHRDAPDFLKESIEREIIQLIKNESVEMFFVGNNGNYDFLVQKVLSKLSQSMGGFEYYIVLSSLAERSLSGNQENTIFPEALERVPPRFAIAKRNEWLIKNSRFAIVYLKHKFSNSSKWVDRAEKKRLKIINIFKSKDQQI